MVNIAIGMEKMDDAVEEAVQAIARNVAKAIDMAMKTNDPVLALMILDEELSKLRTTTFPLKHIRNGVLKSRILN